LTKYINSEFLRFVISGAINTGSSYLLYLLLLLFLPYSIAYTLSYFSGIVLSYYLNSRFVFHQALDWKKAVQYPLVYAVQYLASFLLLTLFVQVLHISDVIAPILVVLASIPLTFSLSRRIIKGRATKMAHEH